MAFYRKEEKHWAVETVDVCPGLLQIDLKPKVSWDIRKSAFSFQFQDL